MSGCFWWFIGMLLCCISLIAFLILYEVGKIAKETDEEDERRSRLDR